MTQDPQPEGYSALDAVLDGRLSFDEAVSRYRTATPGERAAAFGQNLYQGFTGGVMQANGMLLELEGKALDALGMDEWAARFGAAAKDVAGGRLGGVDVTGALGSPAPQTQNDPWYWKTLTTEAPNAAGSMGSMLLTPGPKGFGRVGIASRGALMGGAQGYWEARGAGASDDAAWGAFALNALVGTSEAGIPKLPKNAAQRLGDILSRADKATKGGLMRALVEGTKTGFSEAAQESLQQALSNGIASGLYDEDRKFLAQVAESGRGAFLLGALTGGLAGAGKGPGRPQGASASPQGLSGSPQAQEGYAGSQARTAPVRVAMESLDAETAKAVKDFAAGIGEAVQPVTEADPAIVEFGKRRGVQVQFVSSEDGAPLRKPAGYMADGAVVVVDANAPDAFASLVDHEIGHHVLESVPGARERISELLAPELRQAALEEYRQDEIAAEMRKAGRDLTPEEIQAIEQRVAQSASEDEGITRLAEDFSPVIRLLRTNPEAFSKVEDVGFWRGLVRAVLDVGRSILRLPSAAEQEISRRYRSVARRGQAAKVSPQEGVEIARALTAFLDESIGQTRTSTPQAENKPANSQEMAANEPEVAATDSEVNAASSPIPEPGMAPDVQDSTNQRGSELLNRSKSSLLSELETRIADEERLTREQYPNKPDSWYAKVGDLRDKARIPDNPEGDAAALTLRRMGVKPSGANVEEIVNALEAKRSLATVKRGDFGREAKRAAQEIGKGPQYASPRSQSNLPKPGDTRATKARTYVQNELEGLRRVVEAARAQGKVKSDANDPYLAESLRNSRARTRVQDETEKYVEPIKKLIADSGLAMDDVELYLLARAATDRNALVKARTGKDNGSGMSDAQAAKVISEVNASPQKQAYKDIGTAFDALTKRTRDLWVEYGLESKQTVEDMERSQPTYAPFRSEPDAEGKPRGTGRQIRGREFKAALGRGSMAENPIAYATGDLSRAIIRGETNKARESLYNFVKDVGDPGFAFVDVPPTKDALVNGTVRKVPDFQEAENEVTLKVGGNLRRVRFTEPYSEIAQSLRGLTREQLPENVRKVVQPLTKVPVALSTRWNPFFPPVNFGRDVMGAALNEQSLEIVAPSALKDSAAEVFNRKPRVWLERFRKAGGPVAFLDLQRSPEELAADIRADVERLSGKDPRSLPRRTWAKYLGFVEHINESAEAIVRLSAFRHAVEKLGMSDARAALFAKDITTNFERRGQAAWMNALYAFSNANVQSVDRFARAMKKPGARKLAIALAGGAFVLSMMNRTVGGEDEDGVPYYDKINPWTKQSSAILMIPGGEGRYVSFPLPFMWGWFHVLGDQLATGMQTGDPETAAENIGAAFGNQFNPLGASPSIAQFLAPTAADPFVQMSENKTFSGSRLYPEKFGDKDKPDSELVWDNTNKKLVEITRWLNRVSGGSSTKSGLVDVSPITIEHLVRSYFGGFGGETVRGMESLRRAVTGEDQDFNDVPLIRRYLGEVTLRDARRVFLEHTKLVDNAVKAEKVGDEYDQRLYRIRLRVRGIKDQLGDLEDRVRASDSVSEREELRGKIRKLMTQGVELIRETQK